MTKIEIVRRPSINIPRHLLEYIFFTDIQVKQASRILETISKMGSVHESRWKEFVLSSRGLYIKVMRKLRDIGMVVKNAEDKYILSNDFALALRKIADYWENILSEDGLEF